MAERRLAKWLGIVALGAVALVTSVLSWWELLAAYPKTQNGDGQFFVEMIEAMRVSVIDFHELPLWNPYQCGGIPLWDNPQGVAAAPLFWLLMPLGTTRSIELWYVLHTAFGFVSMWILARRELGLSVGASLVASGAFAFAGTHNQHLTGGHLVWASYLMYPLAIHLWRRAEQDLRYAVGLGALVALIMHEGGAYPLPHLALLLGLETLTRLYPPRRLLPISRAGAVVVAAGFGLGASRFLPVLYQLRGHTRVLGAEHDAMTWQTLKAVFLDGNHGRDVPGQAYAWTEYGDYVGPVLLGLSLLGALLAWRPWMLFLLATTFALMLGDKGQWAPGTLLNKHVYPFTQMRVPSRIVECVTIFLAGYAGLAVDRVSALATRFFSKPLAARLVRAGVLAVGIAGVANMMRVGVVFGRQFATSAPKDVNVHPSPTLYIDGGVLPPFIDQPSQHRPRSECWEEWAFERGAALWPADTPQAKAKNADAKVTSVVRTQNKFEADVVATRPARILFNSLYDAGWRTSVGEVKNDQHLLAVDVPAGSTHLRLHYWPQGLTAGFAIALGTLSLLVWRLLPRRRPAR